MVYKVFKGISIAGLGAIGLDMLDNAIFKDSIKLGDGETRALVYIVIGFWVSTLIMKIVKFVQDAKRDFESFEIEKKERHLEMKKTIEEIQDLKDNHKNDTNN